jgi:hypothetical protein
MVIEAPSNTTVSFALQTRVPPEDFSTTTSDVPAPTAVIVGNVKEIETTGIPITSFRGNKDAIQAGSYAYLNDEVLRIDSVDLNNGTVDVGRGYLDSFPRGHLTGSIIYFAGNGASAIDPAYYVLGDIIDGRPLTRTGLGLLSIGDPGLVSSTVEIAERSYSPYGPSQVKIQGEYFPEAVGSTTVNVTWAYQDRTQQLTIGGEDWYSVSLGSPEVGVKYEVRYYNNDTDVLLFTDQAITGTSSTYTSGSAQGTTFDMRVEVDAIRTTDGNDYYSYYTFSSIFLYVNGDLPVPDPILAYDNPNLTAVYTMDSVAGTVLPDSSPNTNDGFVTGPVTVAGKIANAQEFAGNSTSYGTLPTITDLLGTGAHSIGIWFKADDPNVTPWSQGAIALLSISTPANANGDSAELLLFVTEAAPGYCRVQFQGFAKDPTGTPLSAAGNVVSAEISVDAWHFVILTYNGVGWTFLVDDAVPIYAGPDDLGTAGLTVLEYFDADTVINLGRYITVDPIDIMYFDGTIDQVRFFDREVTVAEKVALYQEPD